MFNVYSEIRKLSFCGLAQNMLMDFPKTSVNILTDLTFIQLEYFHNECDVHLDESNQSTSGTPEEHLITKSSRNISPILDG